MPDMPSEEISPRKVRTSRVSVLNSTWLPLIQPWNLPCWCGPWKTPEMMLPFWVTTMVLSELPGLSML